MRPTGGRAVYHAEEITYCVVSTLKGPFSGSLAQTHRRIAAALLRFYRGLGIRAELTRPAPAVELDPRSPSPCFIASGLAEIETEGRKLAGSAQFRGHRAFLQHGSLPVGPAHLDLAGWLPGSEASRSRARRILAAGSASLAELIPSLPPLPILRSALVEAFAEEFRIEWEERPPGA